MKVQMLNLCRERSDECSGDDYAETETGETSTNVKTHHGYEEWHMGYQMKSESGAVSSAQSLEGRQQQARVGGSILVCPNRVW
jgi:hypothetical protein